MANHTIYTLNATPTRITPLGTHSGMDITIQNINETGYLYVGGDDSLTSANFGYRISPNHAISFELPGLDDLFLVSENVGALAAVLSTSLESQN